MTWRFQIEAEEDANSYEASANCAEDAMMDERPAQMVTRVEFDDTFVFVPLGGNLLPLRRWEYEHRPSSRDLFRTVFEAAALSRPIRLLCLLSGDETDLLNGVEVTLNGQRLEEWQPGRRLDRAVFELDISRVVQPGPNEVIFLSGSAGGLSGKSFWVEGDFIVRRIDEDEVLFPPDHAICLGSWTSQGYPYYWGSAIYRQRVEIPETMRYRRFFVRFQSIGDPVEICVNGTKVGTLDSPPWESDVTDVVVFGENKFEFAIDNSSQNAFGESPGASGLLRPVVLEAR
ncbi:MAG: hypothetical protein ABIH23_00660 [bacterium]